MISEVVCRELFRAAGVYVLDALVVEASANFAASWNSTPNMSVQISGGQYFGTRHRTDVMSGPPSAFADLEHPEQLLRIWVLDSLVCNLDRKNEGNILLQPMAGESSG